MSWDKVSYIYLAIEETKNKDAVRNCPFANTAFRAAETSRPSATLAVLFSSTQWPLQAREATVAGVSSRWVWPQRVCGAQTDAGGAEGERARPDGGPAAVSVPWTGARRLSERDGSPNCAVYGARGLEDQKDAAVKIQAGGRRRIALPCTRVHDKKVALARPAASTTLPGGRCGSKGPTTADGGGPGER